MPSPEGSAKKRKLYGKEDMKLALMAIEERGLSVNDASDEFGIPKTTLRRYMKNQWLDENDGTAQIFTPDEKDQLAKHLNFMASIGYAYRKREIIQMVLEYAYSLEKEVENIENIIDKSWVSKFLKKCHEVPPKVDDASRHCPTDEMCSNYYMHLKSLLKTLDLNERPRNIFVINEIQLDSEVEFSGIKHVCRQLSNSQDTPPDSSKSVSIICGGNALGYHVPPYYVFPGEEDDWDPNFLDGTLRSSNGQCYKGSWMESELFRSYLKFFLKNANYTAGFPILILYDGHKNPIPFHLIEWAKKDNVRFFALPPHSLALLHPVHGGCFSQLKTMFYTECWFHLRKTSSLSITKYAVGALSAPAYRKAISSENLASTFKATGIRPFSAKKAINMPSELTEHMHSQNSDSDEESDNDPPSGDELVSGSESDAGDDENEGGDENDSDKVVDSNEATNESNVAETKNKASDDEKDENGSAVNSESKNADCGDDVKDKTDSVEDDIEEEKQQVENLENGVKTNSSEGKNLKNETSNEEEKTETNMETETGSEKDASSPKDKE